MSEWKEYNLPDDMEPQINTDERRFEAMHLRSTTVFLNVRSGSTQEGGSG